VFTENPENIRMNAAITHGLIKTYEEDLEE